MTSSVRKPTRHAAHTEVYLANINSRCLLTIDVAFAKLSYNLRGEKASEKAKDEKRKNKTYRNRVETSVLGQSVRNHLKSFCESLHAVALHPTNRLGILRELDGYFDLRSTTTSDQKSVEEKERSTASKTQERKRRETR